MYKSGEINAILELNCLIIFLAFSVVSVSMIFNCNVDNIFFMLDMKILFLTVKKVLKKEGVSSTTSATMEKFKGNE